MKRFGEPVIDTPQQHIQQNWYTLAAKQTQNHRFGCTSTRFTENGVKRPKQSGLCTPVFVDDVIFSIQGPIGNESVPVQLARCWFLVMAISNAKIKIYFFK